MKKKSFSFKLLPSQKIKILTTQRVLRYLILAYADLQFLGRCFFVRVLFATVSFCSDDWKSYREFILEHKLMQAKSENFTVEGYNSRIRDYLTRFKTKTKCYSKAKHRMEKSLKLLMLRLNNKLIVLI